MKKNIDYGKALSDLSWSLICYFIDILPFILITYVMYWLNTQHNAEVAVTHTWYSDYRDLGECVFLLYPVFFTLYGIFFSNMGAQSPTKFILHKSAQWLENTLAEYED